jgi:hypothetical protein
VSGWLSIWFTNGMKAVVGQQLCPEVTLGY